MLTQVATDPGTPGSPSEDRAMVAPNFIVVIDGATARTDTGCIHGVAWYADHLASALVEHRDAQPAGALAAAIRQTANLHRDTCDLEHPGAPSAAVGVLQVDGDLLRYLVLGDVTVAIDMGRPDITVISDDRVSQTAKAEREAADALPADSPAKAEALLRMKRAELASRNRPGGYWIAASDPEAVKHALVGTVPLPAVRRVAMLTDGAARAVEPFGLHTWRTLLDSIATNGPGALVAQVRRAEASDPRGVHWPRNKLSDDATIAYCGFAAVTPDGERDHLSRQHRYDPSSG